MTSSYIELPIETDPQDIMDDFVTFMQTLVPGWEPAPGNLDVWIAQAMSLAAAESRDVASAVPRAIFRWFGQNLIRLAPQDAVSAAAMSTWTMKDNLGYTIPLGTQVSIAKTGDEVFAFETVADVVVPPGSTVANNVQLVAITPGVDSTGLGSAGSTVTLIDPLTFVLSITLVNTTAGGADAETDDDYLGRLTEYLRLLAPRPILPADFAVFANNIPGVSRATAIDGYNPAGGGSFNNERTVAVAAIDAAGSPVSAPIKSAIQADLEARREVNFEVNVIDPSINEIDVTYQVQSLPGYDVVNLEAAIDAALSSYLSAANWGTTAGSASDWENIPNIRYLEVAALINSVSGVAYITTTGGNYDLTIGPHGGALGRADLVMTGVAPLPHANTITGTVL